jgi:hypothetical protein
LILDAIKEISREEFENCWIIHTGAQNSEEK